MKKFILSLVSLSLFFTNVFAQAPGIEWQKCYGGSNVDRGRSIALTADGGFLLGAISRSNDGDLTFHHGLDLYNDYWVAKTDASGNITWQKVYGGTNADLLEFAMQTSDGGYIMIGWTYSADGDVTGSQPLGDYWVVKTNSSGTIEWQKALGGSGADHGYRIVQTADGGYILSGSSGSNNGNVSGNHGFADYWLVKINSAGTIQWQKCFGGSSTEEPASVVLTPDGGYILAGTSYSNDQDVSGHHGSTSTGDCWVLKADSARNIVWQHSFGGSNGEEAFDVELTADGGCIVAGMSESNDGDVTGHHGAVNTADVWVFKLDAGGNLQWQKSYGGTDDEEGFDIEVCNDGGYIIAGASASTDGDVTGNHGDADGWILKTDNAGNIEWQKSMGGTLDDESVSIEQTTDGGFIVAGFTNSNDGDVSGNHGTTDAWVVKLAAPTGIPESSPEDSSGFIFPNPFHSFATLQLPSAFREGELKLYNVLGEVVYTSEVKSEKSEINRNNLSAGVYFCKVQGHARQWVRKVIVE